MYSLDMNVDELLVKCYANDHDEKIRDLIEHIHTLKGTELLKKLCDALVDLHTYPTILESITKMIRMLEPETYYCKAVTQCGSVCCKSKFPGQEYCNYHNDRKPTDECPVCMEPMWKKMNTGCEHALCEHCYVQWYIVKDKDTCPMCRDGNKYHKDKYIFHNARITRRLKTMTTEFNNMPTEERGKHVYKMIHTVLVKNASLMYNNSLYAVIGSKLADYERKYRDAFPKECRTLRHMYDSYSEFRFKIMS
jgi:hypothetical protein